MKNFLKEHVKNFYSTKIYSKKILEILNSINKFNERFNHKQKEKIVKRRWFCYKLKQTETNISLYFRNIVFKHEK